MELDFHYAKKFCKECGTLLTLHNNRDVIRKKFCSRTCCTKFVLGAYNVWDHPALVRKMRKNMQGPRPHTSGANNHNWKGGKGTFRKILVRSNKPYECVWCGSQDKLLADHIIPVKRAKRKPGRPIISGDNSLNNLQWLCPKCHWRKHHVTTSV